MFLKILAEASVITEKKSFMDLALNWLKTNWQLATSIGVSILLVILVIILVSILVSKKNDSKNIHYAKMKRMKGVKKE